MLLRQEVIRFHLRSLVQTTIELEVILTPPPSAVARSVSLRLLDNMPPAAQLKNPGDAYGLHTSILIVQCNPEFFLPSNANGEVTLNRTVCGRK